ncbi:MAG TPA: hypothetical protein VEL06_06450 [Haliangiales bacterium]|nr:hypothetical protein [Haliangiales bacterium]
MDHGRTQSAADCGRGPAQQIAEKLIELPLVVDREQIGSEFGFFSFLERGFNMGRVGHHN